MGIFSSSKTCTGIDITDDELFVVTLTRKGNTTQVSSYMKQDLPEGTVLRGAVQKPLELERALRAVRQSMDTKNIHVGVAAGCSESFKYIIPEKMAITEAIQKEVHSRKGTTEEVIVDYDILEHTDEATSVHVCILPEEIVTEYFLIFQKLGLRPVSYEDRMRAIARVAVPTGDEAAYLLVDFRKTAMHVAVVAERIPTMFDTVTLSSEVLSSSVASALNTIYIDWHQSREAEDIRTIETVKMSGQLGNVSGGREFLAARLRVPAEYVNPWENVLSFADTIPELDAGESVQYTGAIGLAFGGIIDL